MKTGIIDENRHKGHEANIQYWRAFAILSIGLLNRDKNLLSQSQEVFQTAMSSITDDPNRPEDDYGFLPFELERRSKALHYHGFASEPILGMALVSKMYGCHFLNSHWRLNQISRLLRKTIQGKYQPEVFTNEIERVFGAKGVTQDSSSDSRRLTYLANEINPAISKNVTEFIARLANATLSTTYGHDKGNPRLGGSYQRLVEAVNLRKTTYSNLLGEVCGGMDYPLNSYRIVLNEPIRSPIVPALRSTKGRIISCNSATPLPVGLSLNSSTCAITGTSRMVQTAASYIINAIVDNPTYEVVTKISIEVQPAQYTKIFSCSKNDSNGGCRVNAKCDAADIIVSTKMACNLESSSLNSDILNSIPKDRLVVVTPSEKVNDGICNLSPGGFVRSGSLALDLAPLKTGSTTASCRELDSNGGDCKLIIQLTCQRNKVVGFD
jgi:hypothetical protein